MSSSQFSEWLTFYRIDPWGQRRDEIRHGQLMHLLDTANFQRKEKLQVSDFMNFEPKPPEKQLTAAEVSAIFGSMLGAK